MFQRFLRGLRQLRSSFVELMTKSTLYRRTTALSALLVIAAFVLPLWRILPLAKDHPFIPLHYNVYLGVDRFGPWYDVFALPALGAVLLVVNLVFETLFYQREKVLSAFFAISTVMAEVVLLVAMILIVLLNL